MPKINPMGKTGKIGVVVKPYQISHIAIAISHSGKVYLSIPKGDVEYWGIRIGDVVHFTIDQFKTPMPMKGEE